VKGATSGGEYAPIKDQVTKPRIEEKPEKEIVEIESTVPTQANNDFPPLQNRKKITVTKQVRMPFYIYCVQKSAKSNIFSCYVRPKSFRIESFAITLIFYSII